MLNLFSKKNFFTYFRKKSKDTSITPSYERKREIINYYREKHNLKCFVETGTFLGETTEYFKDKFDSLYTIELSHDLAMRAQEKFAGDNNVEVICGDSGKVLEALTPAITTEALFWLDGHYSSEFMYNGEFIKTAKANLNTPVEAELKVLMKSTLSNIILVDDARLFNGESDYPTIQQVRDLVSLSNKNYSVTVSEDIIHIVPQ